MQHRGRTLVLSRDRLPTLLDDERTLVIRRPARVPELCATEPDLRSAYRAPVAEAVPPRTGPSNVVLLNKHVVAAYKLSGFAVLTAILFGLGCYVVVNLFYLANRSWVAPTILSRADPRVLATTNVSLATSHAELDARAAELRREVDSLAHAAAGSTGVLAYATLKENRDDYVSLVRTDKARADRAALTASLDAIERTTARYDDVLSAIQGSPYLRALGHDVTVAFVPYENAGNIRKGDPIYGCKMGLVWCKKVGVVGSTLDGEVLGRHPLRGTEIRGIFVEMSLDDPSWAKEGVLHVGRAPLLL